MIKGTVVYSWNRFTYKFIRSDSHELAEHQLDQLVITQFISSDLTQIKILDIAPLPPISRWIALSTVSNSVYIGLHPQSYSIFFGKVEHSLTSNSWWSKLLLNLPGHKVWCNWGTLEWDICI
jgi:hypothetical protein